MKDFLVSVPSADYGWFKVLMDQNQWITEQQGDERPDFEEDHVSGTTKP